MSVLFTEMRAGRDHRSGAGCAGVRVKYESFITAAVILRDHRMRVPRQPLQITEAQSPPLDILLYVVCRCGLGMHMDSFPSRCISYAVNSKTALIGETLVTGGSGARAGPAPLEVHPEA